jgi:hypothetical protein
MTTAYLFDIHHHKAFDFGKFLLIEATVGQRVRVRHDCNGRKCCARSVESVSTRDTHVPAQEDANNNRRSV